MYTQNQTKCDVTYDFLGFFLMHGVALIKVKKGITVDKKGINSFSSLVSHSILFPNMSHITASLSAKSSFRRVISLQSGLRGHLGRAMVKFSIFVITPVLITHKSDGCCLHLRKHTHIGPNGTINITSTSTQLVGDPNHVYSDVNLHGIPWTLFLSQ